LSRWANTIEIKIENLIDRRRKTAFLAPYDKKIFIVHGHDHLILNELETILRESFKLNPVILTRESDNGDTIIEKFERYASECAFAFVLVTPDDMVQSKGKQYFQGRPNVLFELGWFCGRYGRDKVRVLRQRDTQLPSDLNGLISINFQDSLQ